MPTDKSRNTTIMGVTLKTALSENVEEGENQKMMVFGKPATFLMCVAQVRDVQGTKFEGFPKFLLEFAWQ